MLTHQMPSHCRHTTLSCVIQVHMAHFITAPNVHSCHSYVKTPNNFRTVQTAAQRCTMLVTAATTCISFETVVLLRRRRRRSLRCTQACGTSSALAGMSCCSSDSLGAVLQPPHSVTGSCGLSPAAAQRGQPRCCSQGCCTSYAWAGRQQVRQH